MLVALVALGFAGCDNSSTDPAVSGNTRGNGKGPQTLASGCFNIIPGFQHCTIAGTDLQYAAGNITITQFNTIGTGGVASTFANATEWEQDGDIGFPAAGGTLRYSARSAGQVVSTLGFNQTPNGQMEVSATFTGAPGAYQYRLDAYDGALLVASNSGLTAGSPAARYNNQPGCYVRRRKFKTTSGGACQWETVWVNPCPNFPVTMPHGQQVMANRLVFTEVIGSGQYPYRNFNGIDAQGVLNFYNISSEATVAAVNCLNVFPGITNCAVGNAVMAFNPPTGQIIVNNFGPNGTDGVSSTFASAKNWEQDGNVDIAAGGNVTYSAISGGQVVSTFNLVRSTGNEISAAPTFTGSPEAFQYRIDAYNGEQLVGSNTGLTALTPAARYNGGSGCYVRRRKFKNTPGGACQWEMVWVSPCPTVVVNLPFGPPVLANRLVFTEVISSGQYPYRSFTGITVQGRLNSYAISSEFATP